MAFENFPYTDFHALNLDWILREITKLDPLPKEFAELKKWVETYFSDVEVRKAVEEILEKWYLDGTLKKALERPLKSTCAGWVGFNKGWNIAKNGEIFTLSKSVSVRVESMTEVTEKGYWYSNKFTVPVDCPIYLASGSVISGSKFLNFHSFNYDTGNVSFVIGSPVKYIPPFQVYCRIVVQARRPIPPGAPEQGVIPGDTGNKGAYLCAKSFLDAREAGREFAYGRNFMYSSSNKVNDATGKALMECDNLVMMAILGIDYAHSPYADDTPDLTFDFNNLVVNPMGLYPWTARTAPMVKQTNGQWVNGYGARITATSTIAWYLWTNGYVFSDKTQAQTGDIALFRRAQDTNQDGYDNGFFDNVGHMGIIERAEDGLYLLHVTIEKWTAGKVLVRTKLDNFYNLAPGRYHPEDTIFARINFSTP